MKDLNFIPMPMRVVRGRRRRLKAWGVVVTAALALLCIPIVFDQYMQVEASRLAEKNNSLGAVRTDLRRQLETLTASADHLLLQLERARALRSKRAWSAVFALIARCMPEGCWLASIATDPPQPGGGGHRPTPTPAQTARTAAEETVTRIEAPQRLRIVGFATDASEPHRFVANLKATNVFRDVNFETSRREQVQDAWHFRFDLVCEW